MDSDDELHAILIEQSRELDAAKIIEADLDLAFQLQMQEALETSVGLHHSTPSSSSSSTPPQFQLPKDDVSVVSLVAEEIARFDQERCDRKTADAELRRMRDDLGRRIHDQAFARELNQIPDAEWAKTGDYFVRPYGRGLLLRLPLLLLLWFPMWSLSGCISRVWREKRP